MGYQEEGLLMSYRGNMNVVKIGSSLTAEQYKEIVSFC